MPEEHPLRIEILSTDFDVYNGVLFLNDRQVATVQFRIGDNAKRVGKAIRLLRKIGIPVEVPRWSPQL